MILELMVALSVLGATGDTNDNVFFSSWDDIEEPEIDWYAYNNIRHIGSEKNTVMLELMTDEFNELGYNVEVVPTFIDPVGRNCLPKDVLLKSDITSEDCFSEFVNFDTKIVYFNEREVTTSFWKIEGDSWGLNIFEHAMLHVTCDCNFHPYGYSNDLPIVINGKATWIQLTYRSYPD